MELNSNLQSDQHIDSLGMDTLNHRRAAAFLNKAAQIHLEAAKQLLEGDLEEVVERTQGAQDLLLHVCAMHQRARLHLEAAKLRWEGISTVAECEKAQKILRQVAAIQKDSVD